MFQKSKFVKKLYAISALCLACICASAQDIADVTQRGTVDLNTEASALIDGKKFIEARPLIKELLQRFSTESDPASKSRLESLLYFYAMGYVQEFEGNPDNKAPLDEAVKTFDKIIQEYPEGKFAVPSIRQKAVCLNFKGEYAASAESLGKLLEAPYVNSLNNSEQTDVIRQIVDSMYAKRAFDKGEKWFKLLFDRAPDIETKVYAAVTLIHTALFSKNFSEVSKYLPYMVYDFPARYDIALNVAFLTGGDELVKQKNFGLASMFFNMVYTREQILEGLKRYKKALDREVESMKLYAPNNPKIKDKEAYAAYLGRQIEGVEGIESYTAALMARKARNYLLTKRDYESFWSFRRLIKDYPEDPQLEAFYYSAFLGAVNTHKDAEMFALGDEYMKKYPEGQFIREVVLQIAQYYLRTDQKDLFYSTCIDFISKYPEDPYGNQFVFLLGRSWMEDEKYNELRKTFKGFIKDHPDTPLIEGSYYWIGLADLSQGKYPEALENFKYMVENFPGGDYIEDGLYRKGIAAFGVGDFASAREAFEYFVSRFDTSMLVGEVEFFLGDIEAASGNLDAAIKHYMNVELKTDNQNFIDNSYLQGSRLYASAERYQDAINLINRYVEKYPDLKHGNFYFEEGKALEKMGRPADALNLYLDAIVKSGSNPADDGVDKMLMAYSQMYVTNSKRLKATIEFLEKAISDKDFRLMLINVAAKRYRFFQDNPDIEPSLYTKFKKDPAFGKPMLNDTAVLKKLLAQYKEQEAKFPKKDPAGTFLDMLEKAVSANNRALALRCMMILDSLGKPQIVAQSFDAEDIKMGSLKALVWMAKANAPFGPEATEKVINAAIAREEVFYMIDAYFAAAEFYKLNGKPDEAIRFYRQIQNDFPLNDRAAVAAISEADLLFSTNKKKDAIAKYEDILRMAGWRGAAHAEVMYKLGRIAQDENKIDEAIMWYDRCFLGFSSEYAWSGKALLASARLLISQGKNAEAKTVIDEFIKNQKNKASPEYAEIEALSKTL